MIVCNDPRTGAGCGFHNPDGAATCQQCGATLKYAPTLHNVGDSVANSYRIQSVIGHGGFGAVYAAEHVAQPGITYALKQSLDPASMQHFQREMQALQGVDHHNLPHYYEMFEDDNSAYLVMEFIPGQSLGDVLRTSGGDPVPENVVLGYATQLCDALTYLHTLTPPVVHRDIKPDNIRITPAGQIKLVDFGLFKQVQGSQHQSTIRGGTPMYMAIEQMSGGSTPRTDLYGLGATLYHLLTGVPPVPVVDRVGGAPMMPAHQVNPQVSPHVSAAVAQAMELRADDRPASARDLKRQLNQMTQPIPTPNVQRQTHDMTAQAAYVPPTPQVAPVYQTPYQPQPPQQPPYQPQQPPYQPQQPQQPPQRGWMFVAIGAVVLLLLLVVGGVGAYMMQNSNNQVAGGGEATTTPAADAAGANADMPTPDAEATRQALENEGASLANQQTAVALEATREALANATAPPAPTTPPAPAAPAAPPVDPFAGLDTSVCDSAVVVNRPTNPQQIEALLMRSYPSFDGAQTGVVNLGGSVAVLCEPEQWDGERYWVLASDGSTMGWMSKNYLAIGNEVVPAAPPQASSEFCGTGVVTNKASNPQQITALTIRDSPSLNGNRLGTLDLGDSVTLLCAPDEWDGERAWTLITDGSVTGWVSEKYLDIR